MEKKESSCCCSNVGEDFEILVPAQFALRLLESRQVKNFAMNTQSSQDGQRDYLTVKIESTNGSSQFYVFVLEHWSREDSEDASFEETYQKIAEDFEGSCHVILYSNATFNEMTTNQRENFEMFKTDPGGDLDIFDSGPGTVWKFRQVKKRNQERFLDNLSLLLSQRNKGELKEWIETSFQKLVRDYRSVASRYIQFFRDWRRNPFETTQLDPEMVVVQLIDLIASSHVTYLDFGLDRKPQLIEEIFQNFDVTLVELEDDFLASNCVTKVETNQLAANLPTKVPTLCNQIYRIVEVVADNRKFVLEFLKLCQKPNTFKLLFENNTNEDFLSHLRVFKNLGNLLDCNVPLYNQVVEAFSLSLQGREEIKFQQLLEEDEELVNKITMGDFLLLQNGLVGEQRSQLPQNYLVRSVSKTVFTLNTVAKIQNDVIVISGAGKIFEVSGNVTKFDGFCKDEELKLIIQRNQEKNVHHFVALNSKELEWASSSKSVEVLRELEQKTKYVEESQLQIEGFHNRVVVLSGHTGIGKTTMVKRLQNFCPTTYWTLKIDLKEHNSYFQHHRHSHVKETLAYFLNFASNKFCYGKTSDKIRQSFVARKKIVIFWDGLDELQRDNVKPAIDTIEKFRLKGYRQWVTSRLNLRKYLEDLDPFFYEIQEISLVEQEEYVRRTLDSREEIDEIVAKLFGNNHLAVSNSVLGAPLQMHMITEILSQNLDKPPEFVEHVSVLTHMFHNFVTSKFRKYLPAVPVGLVNDAQISRFRAYRAFGMKSCFKPEILFECLDAVTLKHLNEDAKEHVASFRDYGDYLGFVVGVGDDNTAIFEYNVYAEFFAACWMVLNIEHVCNFEEFIFKEEYTNVRYFFDMKLAEEHPEQLAILYRNWQEKATGEARNRTVVVSQTTTLTELRYLTLG